MLAIPQKMPACRIFGRGKETKNKQRQDNSLV